MDLQSEATSIEILRWIGEVSAFLSRIHSFSIGFWFLHWLLAWQNWLHLRLTAKIWTNSFSDDEAKDSKELVPTELAPHTIGQSVVDKPYQISEIETDLDLRVGDPPNQWHRQWYPRLGSSWQSTIRIVPLPPLLGKQTDLVSLGPYWACGRDERAKAIYEIEPCQRFAPSFFSLQTPFGETTDMAEQIGPHCWDWPANLDDFEFEDWLSYRTSSCC